MGKGLAGNRVERSAKREQLVQRGYQAKLRSPDTPQPQRLPEKPGVRTVYQVYRLTPERSTVEVGLPGWSPLWLLGGLLLGLACALVGRRLKIID
jgi:hypothetical protein